MPTYSIRRVTGTLSKEDLDGSVYRAIACSLYFPGLQWIKSYVDDAAGEILCIYEANREEDVWEHARRAGIPCDAVSVVRTIGPSDYPEIT